MDFRPKNTSHLKANFMNTYTILNPVTYTNILMPTLGGACRIVYDPGQGSEGYIQGKTFVIFDETDREGKYDKFYLLSDGQVLYEIGLLSGKWQCKGIGRPHRIVFC